MSEGPGFLEFFILEASEYVEQLDGLLLRGGSSGPDVDSVQRVARALRGTATMAKLPAFAELASAIERVGRAIHDGSLQWEPSLGGALIAAVDDLKTLLHAARTWSPAEDRRAATRAAELSRFAPPRTAGATGASPTSSTSSSFLSTEASNIAAGLELLTTRASDADTAGNVLRRIRALRGVAGIKEVEPLAEALAATEDAGRMLELGQDLSPQGRRLLETAAVHLRALASTLRSGGDIHASTPARESFESALDEWNQADGERERVVPIATLFYADGGAGLVEASANPPTTASDRFRLELVSLGEHLSQVVDAARAAKDSGSKARVLRDLRRALQALESAADSFGEHRIAEFVRTHAQATTDIDFLSISALDDLASVLAQPGTHGERLHARLSELAGRRDIAAAIGAGFGRETPHVTPGVQATPIIPAPIIPVPIIPAPVEPAPVAADPAPTTAAPPPPTPAAPEPPAPAPVVARAPEAPPAATPAARPSGATRPHVAAGAASLLDSGISALESIASKPLMTPIQLPEDEGPVVPIETLLYRGRAALDRAAELRDQLRRVGPTADPDALEELFDLIELARAG